MTHHQALQDFPNIRQVLPHKNNKINLPILQKVLKMMFPWQLHYSLSVNALYKEDLSSLILHHLKPGDLEIFKYVKWLIC
jgi:hypothetical protein